MVGDHGEVTIYNVFKLKPESQYIVKNFLCYGEHKRNKCSKLEEKKYKEEIERQSKKNKQERKREEL